MKTLEFKEIARLLQHSSIVELDETPTKSSEWSMYSGRYKVHASKYPFHLLYLFSKTTKKGLEEAQRALPRSGEVHVVYAESLGRRLDSLKAAFPQATHVWSQREYIASFIRDQLEAYRAQVSLLKPKHYVHPRVLVPAGFTRKVPNPLLSLLKGQLTEAEASAGVLAVLLAEAGQGKTFTTERLAAELATSDRIPIYIRSAQWTSLSVDDLRSWWKTITNAFRYFGGPIGWVEGFEDEFLRVTLSAGLFCIIFDGFDEYVLRNRGEVRAQEALEALRALASATGASILVTSRTSFWGTEVTEDGAAEIPGVQVFRLLPFDRASAGNYFADRLSGKARIDKATELYSALLAQNEALAGRGFVLSLVADLVEHGPSTASLPRGANLTAWLMDALCERERERQKLPLSAPQQLASIRLFFAEVATGVEPSSENLELAVSFSSDLASSDRSSCVQKLKSHPLLRFVDGRWSVAQEQVQFTLLAEYLLRVSESEQTQRDFERFISGITFGLGDVDALSKTVVDVAAFEVEATQAFSRLAALVTRTLLVRGLAPHSPGRRLAVSLATGAVDRFFAKAETHASRTSALRSMLPERQLRELVFSGTLSRYDFRGCEFNGCRFEGVAFVNCDFDAGTAFRGCAFDALRVLRSREFGLVSVVECTKDAESDSAIRDEQISVGKRQYTDDDLKTDFRAALIKFAGKGGSGVRTITEGKLRYGPIGTSKHRDLIISELCRDVIDDHEISGISEKGYHIREDSIQAVKFFLENNVVTGTLRAAYDRIKRRIDIP